MGKVSAGGGHKSFDFCDVICDVISVADLFTAWKTFRKGKRSKADVAKFELNLEENIFTLHDSLISGNWRPDPYIAFYVQDPKLRRIHKASVRDRVLYQAVYQKLYPLFDPTFIHDSYSSRDGKGTHKGVKRFDEFARKATANYSKNAFTLKCDIRKFFDSIDHEILLNLIKRKCSYPFLLNLISKIISSFEISPGKGLPLGNVTSQIFANIYMNELDQFAKHVLKAEYYIRYCDDFVIIDESKDKLESYISQLPIFLHNKLSLHLHPRKISIRKISQGIDFLGYVSLPHYRVLRTRTKRRMFKRISGQNMTSYLGMLIHCKGIKIKNVILSTITRFNTN